MGGDNFKHVAINYRSGKKRRCFDTVSIVVTNNRKALLLRCLKHLIQQNVDTDILIVNNASTDGTEEDLIDNGFLDEKRIHYIYISQNIGGAGGFHYGLKYAFDKNWEWFWLMDDDAEPQPTALENIAKVAEKNNIYGSTAVQLIDNQYMLCFPAKRINDSQFEIISDYENLSPIEQVEWIPFLGFYINRKIIHKIGFPDKYFFIRNDDIEYAIRAKNKGIKLYLIKDSVIAHPFQPTISFNILGHKIYYRGMPPWKMYYEVRNKIVIAKRHYTLLSAIKSIAGVSFQVVMSIFIETKKSSYCAAYIHGILNGVMQK
jgi:GT2 family glycosyltransferase